MFDRSTLSTEADKQLRDRYKQDGFVVLRGAVAQEEIDLLLANFLDITRSVTGKSFPDSHRGEIVDFFLNNLDLESQCYTEIRQHDYLERFSRQTGIVGPVQSILGPRLDLLRKIVFRIDLPRFVQEYAHWHQDYFYVRGDIDTVTAWIPLQDTDYLRGCISVMPGSHRLGPLSHENKIGKRDMPAGIFDRVVRYVEVEKGDLVLFHSLMLHSSNLNFSDSIRYSVQARFTPTGRLIDPGMLGGITLN